MALQFISNGSGQNTAVIIPIDDWNKIKNIYPGIAEMESGLPQWQKDIIDTRLKMIAENPDRLRPIEELCEELNNED